MQRETEISFALTLRRSQFHEVGRRTKAPTNEQTWGLKNHYTYNANSNSHSHHYAWTHSSYFVKF